MFRAPVVVKCVEADPRPQFTLMSECPFWRVAGFDGVGHTCVIS